MNNKYLLIVAILVVLLIRLWIDSLNPLETTQIIRSYFSPDLVISTEGNGWGTASAQRIYKENR